MTSQRLKRGKEYFERVRKNNNVRGITNTKKAIDFIITTQMAEEIKNFFLIVTDYNILAKGVIIVPNSKIVSWLKKGNQ